MGKQGEKTVVDWLKSRGFTVSDVSQEKMYQRDDIDLIVLDPGAELSEEAFDEAWFTAEVKTDTYPNYTVFFETNTAEHGPGALFKSRARVWYIYKSALDAIIEVEPAKVIAYIYWYDRLKNSGLTHKLFPVFNDRRAIRAWGVKLSLDDLTALGGVVHLINATNSEDSGTTEAGV